MKKFIIIDGNAVLHRAFHALPDFKSKDGESIGALYGFISFFLKIVKENNPDFIATTFDTHAPTFRHKKYKSYKATRKKAPDELYEQIPKIKEFLKAIKVATFEKKGYEADDIIGTISKTTPKSIEVIIATGDADAFQLVEENIKVFFLEKGIKQGTFYDKEKVKEKYSNISSENLVEFKALRGDPSDNIPGIPGIGEKTATEIIKKFSTIENLYKNIDNLEEFFSDNIIKKIREGKKDAFLSRELSEIKIDVPISFNLNNCIFKEDKKNLIKFFEKYNFKSFISRILEEKKKNMTLF